MADGIHLDYEAIGKILRVTCKPQINALARKVADRAKADPNTPDDATTSVHPWTTDRAIAVVGLNHPEARALQAKYGILTRAAAAEGLEVKAK